MKKILSFVFIVITCTLLFPSEIISLEYNKTTIEITEKSDSGLSLNYQFSQINSFDVITKNGEFSEISIPNCTFTTKVGNAKLPFLRKLITIPQGAKINFDWQSSNTSEFRLTEFGLENQIIPAQFPIPKSADPTHYEFIYNKDYYNASSYHQQQVISIVELGSMRGNRIVAIDLQPVQYDPASGTIKVYNGIDLQISFSGSNLTSTYYQQHRAFSHYFEPVYQKAFLNYEISNSREDLTRYPVKYVIISDPMFEAQLQPFIDWKIEKGFEVIEAYTGTPAVGNTTESIKTFLQALYDAATPDDPAPTFILFVGDTNQIPAWNGATGDHVTDLYYACLDGNDLIPDMYHGRFSANNANELQPQIDKTMMYEKYEMSDPSYLAEAVMIAGVDANFAPTHGNGQIYYGTENYFNAANNILSHTYFYPESGNSSNIIVQNVSNGVAYANYTAHGNSTSWGDPLFNIADINMLQNYEKYCFAVGNCCLTSKFETPMCFGEAWLRAENKGAIGYIGATNSTFWNEDFWWGVGAGTVSPTPSYTNSGLGVYDGLFHENNEPFADWYTTAGSMIYKGNLAVTEGAGAINYYWEIYTLMGDPSLQTYLGVPIENVVSYPPVIFLGETTINISAEPYSYLALSMDGEIFGAALVDETGNADLELLPFSSTGNAKLVVTRQNLQPYFAEIPVAAVGPYVVVESFFTTDNNNNIPEYNETVSLNMNFANMGTSMADNTTANISTADEFITVTQNSVSIGSITSGEIISLINAFSFDVTDNIPDQHEVNFDVTVNGTGTWISQISITFNAPSFTTGDLQIIDTNGNGLLEPGETAEILIPIFNTGAALSPQVNALLSTSTPELITLINSNYTISQLNGGEEANAVFSVEIGAAVPQGCTAILELAAAAGEYSTNNTYYTAVGNVIEDFENGNMQNFPWILTGAENWEISDNSYEGSYGAKSGDIDDGEYASLKIEFSNIVGGNLSFWKKLSTEANGDYLKFYLDGEQLETWSGEQDWSLENFELTAGQHSVEWKYVKNSSGSSGNDCSWIDFITFPTAGLSFPPLLYSETTMLNVELAAGQTHTEIIEIKNIGGENLDYTALVTGNNEWLNIDPTFGTLTTGETAELTVSIDASGLSIGQYSSAILIQYGENEQFMIVVILNITSTNSDNNLITNKTMLYDNYPNPFNPATTISFSLTTEISENIELIIYNLKGQKIKDLDCSYSFSAGSKKLTHSIVWNGTDNSNKPVSSGVYFYKLKAGDFQQTKKMLLMK